MDRLKQLREHYEKERDRIVRSLQLIDVDIDDHGDEADKVSGRSIFDMTKKLSVRDACRLEKIDIALYKMHGGNVDECEECGTSIGHKRLMAIYGVSICISCAEEMEKT